MKVRNIVLITTIPTALLAVSLLGGSGLVLRLFFLSVLVPLASFLWTVFSIRGISVWAEPPPEHCQVGKKFQQEMTVTNSSRFPKLWLRIEEGTNMGGYRDAEVLNLSAGSSHRWESGVYCRRRGRYDLGTVVVTSTDPFGLFSRKRTLGEPQSVLVYPATFELPLFRSVSFNEFGRSAGYQSISQISPNASSVREFYSGDSLNHIHWRSTAHTGRLMVKLFDADRSSNVAKTVWVVLDMQAASHVGEGDESTEEYAVKIAASMAKKHLDTGMRVGLIAYADQSYYIPPDRGEDHLWRILEALAVARATGKETVGQLLSDQMEQLRGNSIVIIVTASVSGELFDATRQLRNRVDAVVVVQIDASSFGGQPGALNIARNLSATGVQVYVVGQGDELATALDHRVSLLHARHV
ncbi:MAG: DUF58 domain-containing protein [Dehalococcoidales bacterium]|nr:MAG: DUF58 domain-containing protein [Dehalococcoidales bacterium]